jgi:hypothetical protein
MNKFEWDEDKNKANIVKHKISFESAQYVFLDPQALIKLDRMVGSERRKHIIGKALGIIIILAVFTERSGNICIISARKANKKEKVLYGSN